MKPYTGGEPERDAEDIAFRIGGAVVGVFGIVGVIVAAAVAAAWPFYVLFGIGFVLFRVIWLPKVLRRRSRE